MERPVIQYSGRKMLDFVYKQRTYFSELKQQIGGRAGIVVGFVRFFVAHVGGLKLFQGLTKLPNTCCVKLFKVVKVADVLLYRPFSTALFGQ